MDFYFAGLLKLIIERENVRGISRNLSEKRVDQGPTDSRILTKCLLNDLIPTVRERPSQLIECVRATPSSESLGKSGPGPMTRHSAPLAPESELL